MDKGYKHIWRAFKVEGTRDGPGRQRDGQSEHKAWLEARHRPVRSIDISQVVGSHEGFRRRVLALKF